MFGWNFNDENYIGKFSAEMEFCKIDPWKAAASVLKDFDGEGAGHPRSRWAAGTPALPRIRATFSELSVTTLANEQEREHQSTVLGNKTAPGRGGSGFLLNKSKPRPN
jgi:hypothetical protein